MMSSFDKMIADRDAALDALDADGFITHEHDGLPGECYCDNPDASPESGDADDRWESFYEDVDPGPGYFGLGL